MKLNVPCVRHGLIYQKGDADTKQHCDLSIAQRKLEGQSLLGIHRCLDDKNREVV